MSITTLVTILCSTLNTGIAQKEKSSGMTIKDWDVLDNKPHYALETIP